MKCKDIGYGTAECAYNIMLPYRVGMPGELRDKTKIVSIDKCLIREIISLWEQGIRTTGCCCGHGKRRPFISVDYKRDNQMVEMGYERYIRDAYEIEHDLASEEGYFLPKTKLHYDNADKGFNWFDELELDVF